MERHLLKSHSSPRALQLHLCHKAGNCTERVSSRTLSYSTDQWGQPCTNATPSYYHSFKTAFTYDSGNMPAFLFFFMYALAIFGLFKISCELFGRTSQFLQKKKKYCSEYDWDCSTSIQEVGEQQIISQHWVFLFVNMEISLHIYRNMTRYSASRVTRKIN